MDRQDINRCLLSASEQEAIKLAVAADEQHLIELGQSIKGHQTAINSLESTFTKVEARIASRKALIAAYKTIPDEVLGDIFTMDGYQPYRKFGQNEREDDVYWEQSVVSPSEWRRRCPMNICHVSQRWRRVAMSTPKAWSELLVDLKKKHMVDMMKHWFEQAKAVPVHVTLWCESGEGQMIEPPVAQIKKHLHQVGSLRLVVEDETHPGGVDDVIAFCQAMGQAFGGTRGRALQRLAVCSMYADRYIVKASCVLPPFPSEIIENLATLEIQGFFVTDSYMASLPTGLTTLILDAPNKSHRPTEYSNILEALANLPKLRQLRLCGQYPAVYDSANDQSPSDTQQIVHMPHLIRLTLTRYSCATYIRFLNAPALQCFKLKERQTFQEYESIDDWNGIGPLVSSFLARSRPPLKMFSAIDIGSSLKMEELLAWLGQMDALKCLVISQSPPMVDAVVDALVLKQGDGRGFRYCPSLKVFVRRRWGQGNWEQGKGLARNRAAISGYMESDSTWRRWYGAGGRIGMRWKL